MKGAVGVGPHVFGEVRTIAVLRASGLGDFVFALPALAGLRARFPHARIVWLGKPWHKGFLTGRSPLIDEVVALPPIPGVGVAPGTEVDEAAVEACCEALRQRRFDLAFQWHGGGRYSNPFLLSLGARHTLGLATPDAAPLEYSIPYVVWHNERMRLLEVAALAGASVVELEGRLALLQRDRDALEAEAALPQGPLAVLNPGSTDARRRWAPERFAAVGDALAQAGALVVVHGDERERAVTADVVGAMRERAIDLGGKLSLAALAALVARARLVVGNDSGPLHLAQAMGTATVGVYWLTNLFVSGPPTVARHRHALSLRLTCPVCGQQNIDTRCAHDPSFVDDVALDEVLRPALELWLAETAVQAARAPAAGPR